MAAKLDKFTRSYIETAIWSSTDESDESGGIPLDDAGFTIDDLAPEALKSMKKDCDGFREGEAAADLEEARQMGEDDERAGADFWLTRNGHGTGFWDRGLGAVGDRLSDAAHAYGSSDIYVGDDGKLHVS